MSDICTNCIGQQARIELLSEHNATLQRLVTAYQDRSVMLARWLIELGQHPDWCESQGYGRPCDCGLESVLELIRK